MTAQIAGWISPNQGAVLFELIRARDACLSEGIPHGEVGRVETADGKTSVHFDAGCRLELGLEQTANRTMWTGVCRIASCELADPFIILIRMRLANRTQPYFMIPATLYGPNQADRGVVADHVLGTGGDPKLAYRADRVNDCFSHSWHFRADHSSIPSVSANFDGQFAAIGIEEACTNPKGTWVYNAVGFWTSAEHGDSISVSMGSLDWPGRIVSHRMQPGRVVEPLTKAISIGMSCCIIIYGSGSQDRFAYESFIARWYEVIHERPREGAPLERAMRDVATALVQDGIDPQTGYFHMYRAPDGISSSTTLLAWAGVLQIARPLIRVGRILNEPKVIDSAVEMVDRAAKEAVNPANGLFFDTEMGDKWVPADWWPGMGQTSLVNGHACYLLLKMYEDDPSREAWAGAATNMVARVLASQRDDGRFPGGYSPTGGEPTTYRTFGGCFFAAPLLMTSRFFGDPAARDAALRAIEHYWREFTDLEWVGVDMDCAGAVDSGSSYALIRALVELHRQDGDEETLDRIGHVFHYAFTYRFGHNTRHRNAVCEWSSSGAKVTSTHNVHLDTYGGEVLEDLHYFLQHRDDPYLHSRLADSLAWARQAYNRTEAEYGWGKVGWCTEQYYHTYDTYHYFQGDGTVWVAYFPWAAGSLLNAFVVEFSGEPQCERPFSFLEMNAQRYSSPEHRRGWKCTI